jgi:hypothetical protein
MRAAQAHAHAQRGVSRLDSIQQLRLIHSKRKPSRLALSEGVYRRFTHAMSVPFTSALDAQSLVQAQNCDSKTAQMMAKVWKKKQERLSKKTGASLAELEANPGVFDEVEIYVRSTGSWDQNEEHSREVSIALRGFAHTVVVLRNKKGGCYILDRVVEGIRLSPLELASDGHSISKCAKFAPDEMLKLMSYCDVSLSSVEIAQWIKQQSQSQYHLVSNNCVWFSLFFYERFLAHDTLKRFYQRIKETLGSTSSPH